jgi:hypothetical protein
VRPSPPPPPLPPVQPDPTLTPPLPFPPCPTSLHLSPPRYVKIVVIRCATLFILLLSKFSGFFTAADPAYYRRKVTLATGLFLVQLLEFLATWLAQDLHTPGLSFIIMVIICNYSPLRFVTKVLPCFFNLLIYCILVVSSNPDALMQCASLVAFFLVQCLTSYIKE